MPTPNIQMFTEVEDFQRKFQRKSMEPSAQELVPTYDHRVFRVERIEEEWKEIVAEYRLVGYGATASAVNHARIRFQLECIDLIYVLLGTAAVYKMEPPQFSTKPQKHLHNDLGFTLAPGTVHIEDICISIMHGYPAYALRPKLQLGLQEAVRLFHEVISPLEFELAWTTVHTANMEKRLCGGLSKPEKPAGWLKPLDRLKQTEVIAKFLNPMKV